MATKKKPMKKDSYQRKRDREGMYEKILGIPEQVMEGLKLGERPTFPMRYFKKYERIAILGMGASGLAGDVFSNVIQHIDVHPVKTYSVPAYFGDETLALAVTYSGRTEETVAAAIEAAKRGCLLVGMGIPGAMKTACGRLGSPHIDLPEKYQPTRIAPGITVFTPLGILAKLGIFTFTQEDVKEIIENLSEVRKSCAIEVHESKNPAKKFATEIGRLPVAIFAPAGISSVAKRMRDDISENAKRLAWYEVLPEADHNEISSWAGRPKACVILVRSPADEGVQEKEGLALSARVLKRNSAKFLQLTLPHPKSKLARLMAGIYFGIFVSYYMRIAEGKSVAKTPLQEAVKGRLPKGYLEGLLEGLSKPTSPIQLTK